MQIWWQSIHTSTLFYYFEQSTKLRSCKRHCHTHILHSTIQKSLSPLWIGMKLSVNVLLIVWPQKTENTCNNRTENLAVFTFVDRGGGSGGPTCSDCVTETVEALVVFLCFLLFILFWSADPILVILWSRDVKFHKSSSISLEISTSVEQMTKLKGTLISLHSKPIWRILYQILPTMLWKCCNIINEI